MTIYRQTISLKPLVLAMMMGSVIAFAPTPAAAGDYFSAQLETGQHQDSKRTTATYNATIKYHAPTAIKLAYGRHYGQYRLEGEFGYAKSNINEIVGHYGQDTEESGHEEYYSLMINGLMDFKNATKFTPYIGAGLGAVDIHHKASFKPRTTKTFHTDDYTWVFGYQAMAGVNWQVKPKMALSLSYRYFATNGHTHTHTATGGTATYTDFEIDSTKIQYLGLGLNYAF